ncbi:prepilin-type N-terminal cleavage/methylation domain-containing protein [Pseudomonas sp. PB103]|uniref:type II secretion system protein GspJ n=1 Tax=Pseudomonas sp. PB103 TaxID=2494698 RepID=UPI00131B6BFA|nr:type II secretion system protein GspJ [Pseudomonas sp. PB103]KAE9642328.1 prepilin-type N-terminal cleavage/methylation domain-containing protein [Pseudomonas sp. PB103]
MSARQDGFTLIEVMVAIMLMAIVSLIAWRGLDSVTRADSHLQASTEQTEALLRTLHQLERDVALRASIELREPNLTNNDDDPPQGPAAISVRSTDNQSFRLDVIRSAADPQDGLQRVRWWLKNQTLYRAAAPARNRYPLPAPKEAVAVLDSISDLQVRVWEADMGWRQLSGNRKENPQGLEIRLTRETPQGEEHYRQVMGPLD